MNKIVLSHIFLFSANLIYAINYTVAKDVMPDYIQPNGFILLRVIAAVVLFSFSYFLFIRERVARKDILFLAICSLFGVAINQLFFFQGLNLTTPINASIIMTLNPVLVIIISFILFKERITSRKILGIIIALFGTLTLILNGGSLDLKIDLMLGNLLVLINSTSYAIYLVIVKKLINKYHPITVMFYVFLFGLFYVLPFGYHEVININFTRFPSDILYKVIFVLVFTTFVAYLFNAKALKSLNPSIVSIYIYLQPVLATIIAFIFNSDKLDSVKIITCIMIFTGIYFVSEEPPDKFKNKLS